MNQPEDTVPVITIDGPAGAGKSTVARGVAQRLGYAYLDTGAMYRAATWWALHNHVGIEDRNALIESTRAMKLEMRPTDEKMEVFVGGRDISTEIRSPEVTRNIRMLDNIPKLREHLTALQRQFGHAQPTVAEGRDMGTVVFPNARCKIFLDADLDARAERRAAELRAQGAEVDFDTLKTEIHERDESDRNRDTAPLAAAPGAHRLDTTGLNVEQVIGRIVELAGESAG